MPKPLGRSSTRQSRQAKPFVPRRPLRPPRESRAIRKQELGQAFIDLRHQLVDLDRAHIRKIAVIQLATAYLVKLHTKQNLYELEIKELRTKQDELKTKLSDLKEQERKFYRG